MLYPAPLNHNLEKKIGHEIFVKTEKTEYLSNQLTYAHFDLKFISFIIVEFSFHAEKKKFIVWRSENLFSCPRAGKQAVFQL